MSDVVSKVVACSSGEIFDDPCWPILFAEYEHECANKLFGSTSPARETYEGLERMGAAKCFAVITEEVLCGFAFVLIAPVPHYGRKFATVESVFVARAMRGTRLGRMLMLSMEEHAKASGCQGIFYSAPAGSDFARLMFLSENDGYVNTNHIFCRRLN